MKNLLEKYQRNYDDSVGLLTVYRAGYGYHSTLSHATLHIVQESLCYAETMLFNRNCADIPRIEKIIRAVIATQDICEDSITYGLLPYFLEEPIDKMDPPDFNMADFTAKSMLVMLYENDGFLNGVIVREMTEFIRRACALIVKRDCGPDYSNISLMGAFCTLAYGELCGDKAVLDYGRQRLQKLYAYNMSKGCFDEYNSPVYSVIALEEISNMTAYIKDIECRAMLKGLNDIAWKCVAMHFHHGTKQWIGPYTRTYSSFTKSGTLRKIQLGLSGAIDFGIPETDGYDIPQYEMPVGGKMAFNCPEAYYPYFTEDFEREYAIKYLHTESEVYGKGESYSYFSKHYAMGSALKDIMWNQKRNLIAHYIDAGKLGCFYVRMLKDGTDYASAVMTTNQRKCYAASVVGFIHDGGDAHCILDKKHGTMTASELKLRFCFLGGLSHYKAKLLGNAVSVSFGSLDIEVNVPYAAFEENEVKYELSQEQNALVNETGSKLEHSDAVFFDVVLYRGAQKTFRLTENSARAVAFSVSIGTNDTGMASVRSKDGRLTLDFAGMTVDSGQGAQSLDEFYGDGYVATDGVEKMFRLTRKVSETGFSGSYDFYYAWKKEKTQ